MSNLQLLAHPFRVFFILAGIYGLLLIAAWLGFLFAGWPLAFSGSPINWHSHEMLYGFVVAATAGFMLTAMTNWTGARPLTHFPLLALVLLWAAGRLVFWFSAWLSPVIVAIVDLAFLPVLTIYVAKVLSQYNNKRNFVLVAVLLLFSVGNFLMHAGLIQNEHLLIEMGQHHGFDVISLMMVIIGGRIIPAFTRNWLQMQHGNGNQVHQSKKLDALTLAIMISLIPLNWFYAPAWLTGTLAIAAALINGIRLAQWAGWRVLREPLLWILHLAYGWIVAALFLRGLAAFIPSIPSTLWEHALGIGAIGTMILGVMTRVAVGHTGRPLKLQPFAVGIYWAITLAAILRVMAAAQWAPYQLSISAAGVMWVIAFTLFVALYGPIFCQPRADGQPG